MIQSRFIPWSSWLAILSGKKVTYRYVPEPDSQTPSKLILFSSPPFRLIEMSPHFRRFDEPTKRLRIQILRTSTSALQDISEQGMMREGIRQTRYGWAIDEDYETEPGRTVKDAYATWWDSEHESPHLWSDNPTVVNIGDFRII